MLLRPFLNDASSCASYLFGCGTHSQLAVIDPHSQLVDRYVETAASLGAPIVAVFDTHVQADHVSGLPALVEQTGAAAYLPANDSAFHLLVVRHVDMDPHDIIWCCSRCLQCHSQVL